MHDLIWIGNTLYPRWMVIAAGGRRVLGRVRAVRLLHSGLDAVMLSSEAIGRQEMLSKASRACPSCGETWQIQLISSHWPARWKCRKCKTAYEGEPDRKE